MIRLFLDKDGDNVGINENSIVSISHYEDGRKDRFDIIIIKTINNEKYYVQGTLLSIVRFLNESKVSSFSIYYDNEYRN